MVSGLELIDKPEENKYEWFTLRKHRTDAVHDRLKEEAQTYKEIDSLDELTKEQWEFFADTVSENVWWHGKRFRKCCRGEWDIKPGSDEAQEREKLVALREAENGH